MAESPFSVGSGKPTISRVPEGGGGAFRPRPVRGAAKVRGTEAPPLTAESLQAPGAMPASSEGTAARGEDHSALWARLQAINARRQALKDRRAQWAVEEEGIDG